MASEKLTGLLSLEEQDPQMYDLIELEKNRQWKSLELIASENFTSRAVMDCLGSALTNKYSEGIPHARYYGGNEIVDQVEILCQERALAAYRLDDKEWGVNVQPYSGSPANFAVYTALLKPHDRIMGLDLPSGGHLTHGFYTYSKKEGTRKAVSATSVYFESLPYRVDQVTGYIDYDQLARDASLFKPAMIICGGSAYPREWDYARFRKIADDNGALLLTDMAHISGLVATEEADSPFEYADVVTTTTHKSLRGPRAGMIFFKKRFETAINQAVFPALQGGPHEHQIAGVATQLKEVMTPEFVVYSKQVKANAKACGAKLVSLGCSLATGGTDNHLVLWDLKPEGITGSKFEKTCDAVCITLNKNCVPGDVSAITPGGVRIGSPALTTRGFDEADFEQVAVFLHETLVVALAIQKESGPKLKDFCKCLENNAKIDDLRKRVNTFSTKFPMPGFDCTTMKYNTI
uniref:Serine hydroxymethyltransferase n=1 Tax=Eucampia antarctica TaxID=49252 RepID=A0A7S2R9J6_9STRA|mmetsp:Transcript_19029/g.18291  ORF Transcript_19029/g.18291 Transcript_19029/m.18291 type:complete len:463 (+) Transcript_19029:120-1508(+)|eukprot:CAMPEP_0197822912 /NCGR_PEP_ID=MMETSP1437-20131217/216_1 /TAXON_ID=49252 ORGANISM="Eucampia antarctica, Strain CCMP1452" /NCGR_SAMPLE_ID=MMETSP1437 /ASSEMBLY_ACC=CAM_ASM_001096 /LENGTH=462 /DNA_ID=CAMNT_0043421797 /DNA_START=28 /DNA_END=1416 /DNA_ORIENTATION=+